LRILRQLGRRDELEAHLRIMIEQAKAPGDSFEGWLRSSSLAEAYLSIGRVNSAYSAYERMLDKLTPSHRKWPPIQMPSTEFSRKELGFVASLVNRYAQILSYQGSFDDANRYFGLRIEFGGLIAEAIRAEINYSNTVDAVKRMDEARKQLLLTKYAYTKKGFVLLLKWLLDQEQENVFPRGRARRELRSVERVFSTVKGLDPENAHARIGLALCEGPSDGPLREWLAAAHRYLTGEDARTRLDQMLLHAPLLCIPMMSLGRSWAIFVNR